MGGEGWRPGAANQGRRTAQSNEASASGSCNGTRLPAAAGDIAGPRLTAKHRFNKATVRPRVRSIMVNCIAINAVIEFSMDFLAPANIWKRAYRSPSAISMQSGFRPS